MVKKYDWAELKLEYFQSDIDDVSSFLIQKGFKSLWGKYGVKTKWRNKEKQAYKQKIIEKALKKSAEKKANELEVPIEALQLWKKNALVGIMNDLTKNSEKMSMSDKVKWLNALKTELWEPTTVSKNENVNKNEPLDVNDFIRD